jgi:hypothetical protein
MKPQSADLHVIGIIRKPPIQPLDRPSRTHVFRIILAKNAVGDCRFSAFSASFLGRD